MNDVNWHYLDDPETGLQVDESYELLRQLCDSKILVETNITFRISNSAFFEPWSDRLKDCDEKLIRFAFFE